MIPTNHETSRNARDHCVLSNASHEVLVSFRGGLNAVSWRWNRDDETLKILKEARDEKEIEQGGFDFGYPILFPFQNRIREGKFVFENREYSIPPNWKDGNAIHGFACDAAWAVLEHGADEDKGAFVTARYAIADEPEIYQVFPFALSLTATFRLKNDSLILEMEARNEGDANAPLGIGVHPWFYTPFTPAGKRADCRLEVPARSYWELESEEQLVPTGRVLSLDASRDFSTGKPLGDVFLDDIYTQLIYQGDEHRCVLEDPSSNVRLEMRSSRSFREFVVYAPLDDDVICLEPYTSASDFANLAARGVDAGLMTLRPNESWNGTIACTLSTHSF